LARGELRTIAATTWSEYKKYFEKDAALARRFQVVKIEEPSETLAAAMLRGMASLMEKHFNVRVLDDAITEAVRLSHRYISGRQLPDKAISVLDTACAKVALAHTSTPAAIDDTKKRLERIDAEIAALEREVASGALHDERLAQLRELREEDLKDLAEDEARYDKERALVREIVGLRAEIDAARVSSADAEQGAKAQQARETLAVRVAELRALQGGQPMVPLQVDGHVVAEIVASWTGIPLGRMVKDEIQTVLNLQPLLGARVIGQDHALEAIAQRVRTASANLEDPNKPRGVFMFVGPSGVGKTETALALADVLYGGERKMVTINMSEYQEAHSVSGLKGSPPGYVGYGEGGVLTEAVRRNPYSVVLLDEVEKAHPDVLEMFFQVFDKGTMDDAEGREIDFRNTLIILTSNVGSQAVMQACLNKTAEELPDADALAETLRPQLYKAFKPAFLGRMKVVPYYPISDDVLAEIIALKLERIRRRIESNHKAVFEWDESLVDAVLARCTEVDSGARNVDHILNGTLLPEVAQHVLERIANGVAIQRISVRASEAGEFEYAVA
jgi:type VI secretion system protein VasG